MCIKVSSYVRQVHDEVVGVCSLRSLHHLLIRYSLFSEPDVFSDRRREQARLLLDDSNNVTQPAYVQSSKVVTIQRHLRIYSKLYAMCLFCKYFATNK